MADRGNPIALRTPRDLIAETRERFLGDTSEHKMEVLLDQGLYRHLRFRKPGTVIYGFSILTWPGYLAIVGDAGDFVFSRIPDMFEFFSQDHGINPRYWSEKLRAPKPDGAERFSPERFEQHVHQWLDDVTAGMEADDARELHGAVDDQILSQGCTSEHEAQWLLYEFEHAGWRITESWEWDLRDWDWSFLWCCWAITWGIAQYRAYAPPPKKRWYSRLSRRALP